MISFDTNILIYATDMDEPLRQSAAVRLIETAANTDAVLAEQTLIEFISTATRKARMPFEVATTVVRGWLRSFELLTPGPTVIEDVLDLLDKYHLSAWDARLLAVCARAGCTVLMSEDLQDGGEYAGLRVLNPFNPANERFLAQVLHG